MRVSTADETRSAVRLRLADEGEIVLIKGNALLPDVLDDRERQGAAWREIGGYTDLNWRMVTNVAMAVLYHNTTKRAVWLRLRRKFFPGIL
jgi:hypothetical protein